MIMDKPPDKNEAGIKTVTDNTNTHSSQTADVVNTDETESKKNLEDNLLIRETSFPNQTLSHGEMSGDAFNPKHITNADGGESMEHKDATSRISDAEPAQKTGHDVRGQNESSQAQPDVIPKSSYTYSGIHWYGYRPHFDAFPTGVNPRQELQATEYPGHQSIRYPGPSVLPLYRNPSSQAMQPPGPLPPQYYLNPYPNPHHTWHATVPTVQSSQSSQSIPVYVSCDGTPKTLYVQTPYSAPTTSVDFVKLVNSPPRSGEPPHSQLCYFPSVGKTHPPVFSPPTTSQPSQSYRYETPVHTSLGLRMEVPQIATGSQSSEPVKTVTAQPTLQSSDKESDKNPRPIQTVDEHKIFIENASKKTPMECIENFLEAKTELTIESIVPGGRTGSFLITFKETPDIEHLQSLFMKRQIDDSWLKVSQVMKPCSVKVSSLKPDTTEDNVNFYFMNTRKSNGGDVRSVRMSKDCTSAVVIFYDPAVAERVCEKDHKINGQEVSVRLFQEYLPENQEYLHDSTTKHYHQQQHCQPRKTHTEADRRQQKPQHQQSETQPQAKPNLQQKQPFNPDTDKSRQHVATREDTPKIPQGEAPKCIMVRSLDRNLTHFLWKSNLYQQQFTKYIQESCSGRVRFIPQPNCNILLVVDYRGTDSGYGLWKKTIEKEIVEYVTECLKLMAVHVSVPQDAQKRVNRAINPMLKRFPQLVKCFQDPNEADITVYGERGKVDTIKNEILKAIKSSQHIPDENTLPPQSSEEDWNTGKTSQSTREPENVPQRKETIELQPHQTHYLILVKFAERFPKVKTLFDTSVNTATFEGPRNFVISAKTECLRILQNLETEDVKFKSKEAMDLFDTPKTSELVHQKLQSVRCTWERIISEVKVRLYADTKADVLKGKEILEKCIHEMPISLDSSTENILTKAEWKEKKWELMEMYKGKLGFVKEKKNLLIVCTSDIGEEIKKDVDQFLKANYFRSMTVPLAGPIARFLRLFRANEIHSLEGELQKYQLKILVDEGIVCDEIRLSGYGNGCTEAEKRISVMISKIFCKHHEIKLPGIEEFFVKGKGRELLVAVEHHEKCIIEPKDSSPAVTSKEIKRWDVPGGGILCVVLGDMRDLKVDAIVNAANKDLQHAGGVARAIVEKGGKGIQKESDRYIQSYGQLSDGQAVCTAGGKLPCKVIIHAVGPMWSGGEQGEEAILQDTVKNILNVTQKNKLFSVAIPAISTGIFGYPLAEAVNSIMETLMNHWQPDSEDVTLKEVYLCDIKKETVELFVKVGERLFGSDDSSDAEAGNDDNDRGESSEDESILKEEPLHNSFSSSDSEADNDMETETVEGSLNTDVDDSPGIKIVKKELSAMKADVLVSPSKCDLDLSSGSVSRSLLKAGGEELQEECNTKYEEGIMHGELAVTKGGNLQCKAVFHGLLMRWNQGKGKAEMILNNLVIKCLEEAQKNKFKSVAFPALGTGKQGFPADIAASIMFKASRTYLDNNPGSSVQIIYFVIHPDERAIFKAFKEEENPVDEDSLFTSSRSSTPQHRPSSRRNRTFGGASGSSQMTSYQLGSVSVDILQGDITKETTDCVVNSCRESCDLGYSAISKALLKTAGYSLQRECSAKRSDMSKYGFILTSSGNLQCKMVAHLKVQTSNWGWISVLRKCLDRLNKKNITSVSIPALGTGGLKQSPEKMACAIYDAIMKFGSSHRHPQLRHVRVVIFKDEMVNSFQNVFEGRRSFQSHHSQRDRTGQRKGKKGSRHQSKRDEDDGVLDVSNRHIDDSVTLCIYTDNKKSVESAKARITKLCQEEFDHKPLSETWNTFIQKLKNKEVSALYRIADEGGVALTKTASGLALTGLVRLVSGAHDKILDKLQALQKVAQRQEEANVVAKLVEWAYIDEKGHSKLFTPGLNCRLEKAKNDKQGKIDVVDSKGRQYTVDLDKMLEYPHDGGPPITIRRIEKGGSPGLGQYVEGEKKALSGTTTVYFPLVPERNFKGTAEDLHFRTAESQFYRLLSGHSSNYKVSKVEYVVNPHLVKTFRSAQEDLKKSRGEMYAQPVLAFHGTNVNSITSICEKGFLKAGDAGFQMKSGNKYGSGVYFSEYPDYSMGYISGATKLLLCKVLLGKTYTISSFTSGGVQAGYDSHTSSDGKELVIFDTSRILPCYIVHYSQTAGILSYV